MVSHYDEFGLFGENIEEFGLAVEAAPVVSRVETTVTGVDDPERMVSALRWGDREPELVLVHGMAQNAHTWDTVALCLDQPLIAIDLPGHGRSGWRADGAYDPVNMADDLAVVVAGLAPRAAAVVGMSMGGLTAMQLAVRHPALVRTLVMVDVTPGVNAAKTKAITDFVDGPQRFDSFEELLARTMDHNPTRSESSLRRGILHNAHPLPDGSWEWNYDRGSRARRRSTGHAVVPDVVSTWPSMWDEFAAVSCPMMLVCGALSPVVDADDVVEARRLQPALTVEVVDGAGHSIQGDRPVELAALLDGWLATGRAQS